MPDEIFSFTPEQKTKLEQWKAFLDSEQLKQWTVEENQAIKSFHSILTQAKFREGSDLSAEQLDDVFRHVRQLIKNRALTKNLYANNGLTNFNSRLRSLFFSNELFPKRIDQFVKLKGVRMLTVSQFLCAFDPKSYPEINWPTIDVLELDSSQLDSAHRQALKEYNISSPQDYSDYTLEYLRYTIIFREIKSLLNIDVYNTINNVLWLAHQQLGDEEKPPITYITSVSLETDLRDHLAENPSLIEKGLSLISKEYSISDAGKADLLCRDMRGNHVVVETKKGRESDKVVGQVLRYIGGLMKESKRVRGIIIVHKPDDKLNLAIEPVKNLVKLKYYKVRFEITDSYSDDLD